MELEHSFTVPLPVEAAWQEFQDIGSVAECFPGATVTSSDDDGFAGTVKVKLGPIALVYTGSGTFVERDAAARRMVIDARGKDKRGNGTAGAHVVLEMREDGAATAVRVTTDLAITGKPAQFGRGVMQDVSDKLLGQFVACLEQRHAAPPAAAPGAEPPAEPALHLAAPREGATGPPTAPPAKTPAAGTAAGGGQDALDLGSAALPVLARTYGPRVAGLLVLLGTVLWLRALLRRGRG